MMKKIIAVVALSLSAANFAFADDTTNMGAQADTNGNVTTTTPNTTTTTDSNTTGSVTTPTTNNGTSDSDAANNADAKVNQ